MEAEGAEVVEAEDVVGVAVGVEDGVEVADVFAEGLGVEVGAGVDDDGVVLPGDEDGGAGAAVVRGGAGRPGRAAWRRGRRRRGSRAWGRPWRCRCRGR